MTTGLILLIVTGVALAVVFGLRHVAPKPQPRSAAGRVRRAAADLARSQDGPQGQLDQLDTVPEGVSLADLLAGRPGPPVPPEALLRRAERLQSRFSRAQAPEPMRALARLLIDTVDAGLPDAYAFHDAARVFLATAPRDVLAEFAPEAEARFDALTPWLEIDLSVAALRTVRDREPGPLDGLVEAAELRRDTQHLARVDDYLARIGACAAHGQSAAGDGLMLASYVGNRPALIPRAVSEMAMHPGDPVWTAAWLMLEQRMLAAGHLSNIPAFRSRVMASLRSDDPALVAAAADAAEQMLEADAAGDLSVVWGAVGAALNRFTPPPGQLLALADRLGIARPQAGT